MRPTPLAVDIVAAAIRTPSEIVTVASMAEVPDRLGDQMHRLLAAAGRRRTTRRFRTLNSPAQASLSPGHERHSLRPKSVLLGRQRKRSSLRSALVELPIWLWAQPQGAKDRNCLLLLQEILAL